MTGRLWESWQKPEADNADPEGWPRPTEGGEGAAMGSAEVREGAEQRGLPDWEWRET